MIPSLSYNSIHFECGYVLPAGVQASYMIYMKRAEIMSDVSAYLRLCQ